MLCREVWEMSVKVGTLKTPGMRTSAKLTKGDRRQKRMRISDAAMHARRMASVKLPVPDTGGSDDEFSPPDAAAIARMKALLAGQADDKLADL
jgi:hypothetical protein